MKALRIEGVRTNSVCDIDAQPLKANDVRVKVHFVGLCGSDLNTFRGLNPLATFPRIPGHEVSGVIVEKGADVGDGVRIGQNVALWPYSACGECTTCRRGRAYACRHNQTLGVQRDGTLREDIVLPASAVIANDALPLKRLALVEPLSVGFHAARRGSVAKGDVVVVLGCGMIGLGAVMAAARRGARVIAVDPVATKKDSALACGASEFLALTGDDLVAEVKRLTNDDGADVIIEAVGIPATFIVAVDLAAWGARIVYVGYSKAPVTYETKFFNLKELDIFGSRNAAREDFDAVIEALETFGDRADFLITKEYTLQDAAAALPHWDENTGDVLKLMVAL